MKFIKFLIMVLVLALGALLIAAQDTDTPLAPDANACYAGGSMEGKCDTEWEWDCGWYAIRYERGIYSADEMPERCESLLPSEPIVIPAVPAVEATEEVDPCVVDSRPIMGRIDTPIDPCSVG